MSVFLNNVDDYLGPSQACVNPLFTAPTKQSQSISSTSNPPPVENLNQPQSNSVGAAQNINDAPQPTDSIEAGGDPKRDQNGGVNKRRIRRRPAPRVIKCEENDQPKNDKIKSTGGPVRLVHETVENEAGNDAISLIDTTKSEFSSTSQTIKKKTKATVTLSDCLSCSGCVTSAEAVLMSHHSIEKLREVALSQQDPPRKDIVFTISSGSLADLYRHLYLEVGSGSCKGDGDFDVETSKRPIHPRNPITRDELLEKISAFLKTEFGAKMIVDGAVSQRISLMESASEFCYRYNQHQQRSGDNSLGLDMTSIALSSTETRYIHKKSTAAAADDDDTLMEVTTLNHPPGRFIEGDEKNDGPTESFAQNGLDSTALLNSNMQSSLPMLSSSCPGFVCLVEKTAPMAVPLLSSAKSPMAVAGTLLKTGLWNKGSNVYHVAIMPCHDKKLEAGRSDLAWERQALLQYGNASLNGVPGENNDDIVNEVDLVLTTGELLEILSDTAEKQTAKKSNSQTKQVPSATEDMSEHPSPIMVRDFLESQSPSIGHLDEVTTERFHEHGHETNIVASVSHLEGSQKAIDNQELDSGVHGSGSYADYIFRYAAWNLFGCVLPLNKALPWKSSTSSAASISAAGKAVGVLRRRRRRQETTDLRDIALYRHSNGSYSCNSESSDDGICRPTPVLRFATAYGFKNVQLILQNLSKDKESSDSYDSYGYDYVEVMACPSGCPNGGGQIGAIGQRETPRETKERVRKTVSVVPIIRPMNENESLALALYGRDTTTDGNRTKQDSRNADNISNSIALLQGGCFGKHARRLFHTRFHVVPKLELSTGATAGVALSDTNW